MDKGRERRGHRFAPYGDAFLLGGTSRPAGARIKTRLPRSLQQPLKLEIKETKSTVGPTKEGGFLGFPFQGPPS